MVQKRGTSVVILLLVVLFINSVSAGIIEQLPHIEDKSLDEQLNIPFTYAVGIAADVGNDDTNACNPAAAAFGMLDVKGAYVEFPGSNSACEWHGLPNDQHGCYFLVDEIDGDNDPDDDFEKGWSDDCAGWIIPLWKSIDYNGITSGGNYFFDDDLSKMFLNSLVSRLGGPKKNYGEHSALTDYQAMNNHPGCLFKSFSFSSFNRAYICLEQKLESRWYICDEESFGKFIPIPAEPVSCTVDSECAMTTECQGENGQNNCFCNEYNHCQLKGEEEVGAGNPQAWFCKKNKENNYFWDQRDLTCRNLESVGENCDDNEKVCLNSGNDWLATANNKCCGDDNDDFGMTADNAIAITVEQGNPICLNKEWTTPNDWSVSESCQGKDWCWVSAPENSYRIFTLKKPLDKVMRTGYDIVSNGEEWVVCGGGNFGALDTTDLIPENQPDANRFYCYYGDKQYSFADCKQGEPPAELANLKERYKGDGLWKIPVNKVDEYLYSASFSTPQYELQAGKKGLDINFPVGTSANIEFFVRFIGEDKFTLPVGLNLVIKGPKPSPTTGRVIYFSQNVLGYAQTSLEKNKWLHIKVPLTNELYGIEEITLEATPADNQIEVKGLQVTWETPGGKVPICSGEKTAEGSAWRESFDFHKSRSYSAENMCNEFFSPEEKVAWLGNSIDLPGLPAERQCCGDDLAEYYAGPSKAVDGKHYGCWNSQPIKDGETTMNVEVGVKYYQHTPTINYPPVTFGYKLEGKYEYARSTGAAYYITVSAPPELTTTKLAVSASNTPNNFILDSVSIKQPFMIGFDQLTIETTDTKERKDTVSGVNVVDEYLLKEITPVTTIYGPPGATIEFSIFNKATGEKMDKITVPDNLIVPPGEDAQSVYLAIYNYITSNFVLQAETQTVFVPTIAVIGELTPNKQDEFTFSCPQKEGEEVSECLYPLPGQPLYRITNPHPDLYELYFVGDVNEDGLLDSQELQGMPITQTDQQFNVPGTLKAKKVSQQVVLVNTLDPDSEEEGQEARFYGCQAADSIEEDNLPAGFTDYENLGYCQVKADKFCSPSLRHAGTAAEQKEFTTINSWSAEPAGVIGYRAITEAQQADVESFYANRQLQLKTGEELTSSLVFGTKKISELTAAMRDYSASVLPARNFLSNAQFDTIGTELPHWTILDSNGHELSNEKGRVEGGIIKLQPGEKLRSERIAVPQEAELTFTQTSDCNVQIKLVDKDGKKKIVPSNSVLSIPAEKNSYALIEFTGPCEIQQPMLQVVDELGAAAYYDLITGLEDDARTGLSCCPQNYCWNGYACVEPMGSFTYLAEHVGEGRDYRCLNGEWSYMPVRKDWNNDNWGFCEQEEQCLVMSSSEGASSQSRAADFYNLAVGGATNPPPTCINNNEYIFDHYCQQGNWSSRTKFIATKLLEVAGDEYTLYCTSYRDALLNTSNQGEKDSFLGGLGEGTGSDQPSDPLASAQPQQLSTCFKLKGVKNLVPDEENTCINNVCLLKDEDGKVALATSLNKNATDDDPFFLALNIPPENVNEICQGEGEFIECDLGGLDIDGDLWYSKELNAIVYGKDGISLEPGLMDKIIDWFQNLLGISAESELAEEQQFVQQAQNFRELYISTEGGRKVRAMQEIFSDKKALVAEFENFDSSVCAYIDNLQKPTSTELLEEVTGQVSVSCSQTENRQRLEAFTDLEFLWPQLSGMLRAG